MLTAATTTDRPLRARVPDLDAADNDVRCEGALYRRVGGGHELLTNLLVVPATLVVANVFSAGPGWAAGQGVP